MDASLPIRELMFDDIDLFTHAAAGGAGGRRQPGKFLKELPGSATPTQPAD
jgi:hypothetical protein